MVPGLGQGSVSHAVTLYREASSSREKGIALRPRHQLLFQPGWEGRVAQHVSHRPPACRPGSTVGEHVAGIGIGPASVDDILA